MRTHAFLLCAAAWLMISPALAEPPDIEDTDYLTGCLKEGELLSFEISGWGAYRPCWKHGSDAEWVTLPRANQNSQLFTVAIKEARGRLLSGPFSTLGDTFSDLILIKEIGAFRVYSLVGDCGIAVGPSGLVGETESHLGFPKGGFFAGGAGNTGLQEPYLIDAGTRGVEAVTWRLGDPDEVFSNIDGELLIPRFIFGSVGQLCTIAITFEYLETPYAHTVYWHDRFADEVTVGYRREK